MFVSQYILTLNFFNFFESFETACSAPSPVSHRSYICLPALSLLLTKTLGLHEEHVDHGYYSGYGYRYKFCIRHHTTRTT